jgi:predicted transcriptional regulator
METKDSINWENLGYLIVNKNSLKIMKTLSRVETTPTSLSKECNLNISVISKNLNRLERRGLVFCLTPNNRKGKIFSLSKEGKSILKLIDKIMI